MSQVKAFKMVGGEEVVATVVEEISSNRVLTEGSPTSRGAITAYVVRKPHVLRFQPVAPGQIGLAFVPWTLSNPDIDRLEIPASAVVFTFDPSEQVEKQYIEQTSGIELVRGAGFKV